MPWYRIIEPEAELEILHLRELELSTNLSAFQFLLHQVPQKLLDNNKIDDIGIVLKQNSTRIMNWNSDFIADDSSKKLFSDKFRKRKKQNYVVYEENDVREEVEILYQMKCRIIARKKGLEDANNFKLRWTQGVFLYQFSDIEFVVINPDNIESCIKGYAFSKIVEMKLGRKIEFVTTRENGEGFDMLNRNYVKKLLNNEDTIEKIEKLIDQYVEIIQPPSSLLIPKFFSPIKEKSQSQFLK